MNTFYILITVIFCIGFLAKLAYHVLFEIPRDRSLLGDEREATR